MQVPTCKSKEQAIGTASSLREKRYLEPRPNLCSCGASSRASPPGYPADDQWALSSQLSA